MLVLIFHMYLGENQKVRGMWGLMMSVCDLTDFEGKGEIGEKDGRDRDTGGTDKNSQEWAMGKFNRQTRLDWYACCCTLFIIAVFGFLACCTRISTYRKSMNEWMNEWGWKKGILARVICYVTWQLLTSMVVDVWSTETAVGMSFATQWHVCWFGIYGVIRCL